MLGAVAMRIKNSATIIVSEAFCRAGLRKCTQHAEHFLESGIERGRNVHFITRREHARMRQIALARRRFDRDKALRGGKGGVTAVLPIRAPDIRIVI